MIEVVSLARGVSLTSKRLDLGDGVSVQVDGVAADHSLFCEAFAHQGPLKGGQTHKVLGDAFKLAYLARRWPNAELLLVFSDDQAARRFQTGRSWVVKAIEAFGVKVEVGHAGEEGSGMRAGELNHVTLADRRSGISKEARFP